MSAHWIENDNHNEKKATCTLIMKADSKPASEDDCEKESGVAISNESTESNTQAPPKPQRKVRPTVPFRKVDHMPSWRVLLHNDDTNEMNFVVDSILRLTPLTFETAYRCMLEAHEHGLSILLVTHQERAELYRDQFRSKRLVVSIEPVG